MSLKFIKTFEKYDYENEKLTGEELKILGNFVRFLPDDFPELLNKRVKERNIGKDGAFFMMIGEFIDKYGKHEDKLLSLTVSTDEIFDFLDDKYGKGTIEW